MVTPRVHLNEAPYDMIQHQTHNFNVVRNSCCTRIYGVMKYLTFPRMFALVPPLSDIPLVAMVFNAIHCSLCNSHQNCAFYMTAILQRLCKGLLQNRQSLPKPKEMDITRQRAKFTTSVFAWHPVRRAPLGPGSTIGPAFRSAKTLLARGQISRTAHTDMPIKHHPPLPLHFVGTGR